MVKFYPSLSHDLQTWALAQPIFFISSAPLTGSHVNLSPKGLPSTTFTIFSPTSCGYIDATGSGAETISHLYENRRATIMFCSFSASPRILRLFCTGRVVEWDRPEFDALLSKMGKRRIDGARAVLVFDIFKVQTSCGYGVPKISSSPQGDEGRAFEDRETLGHWASVKVERNEIAAYQVMNNACSLDGLPGLKSARRDGGEVLAVGDVMAGGRRVWGQKGALGVGLAIGMAVVLLAQYSTSFLGWAFLPE
ncbi:pyridoxamine phosphate oxidase [Amylocarpus encephaloides]|uniref:Pyridoxamine phosphate oxidase n=1 Tax=Amylocarpus encephaloides TaxID=45428 RepID=A0A9P7YJS5_9HELO|nr:pyridoxamine phosphate oxidase [Amylocarpus encephaloides]